MKHFVLMTEQLTPDEEATLLAGLIQANGMAWAHYLPGSWLLADPERRQNVEAIHENLKRLFPNKRWIVLRVQAEGWATRLKESEVRAQSEWFKEYRWAPKTE